MKKVLKSVISCILCVMLLVPLFSNCVTAADTENASLSEYFEDVTSKATLAKVINAVSNFLLNKVLLGSLAMFIPANDRVAIMKDFKLDEYGNFYEGNEKFLDKPAQGAVWSLGYAEKSIIPSDFGAKFKYARASYVPWWYSTETYKDDDGNSEDLRVRTVILDDASGRGKTAFCVIDCIGIANTDIRRIRAAVADFAAENGIISINVSATHTHTGLDTQGVWTKPFTTLFGNLFSSIGLTKSKSGVDETLLQTIVDSTAASIKEAYADMKQGDLWYASADISDYVHDRTPPYSYDGNLYKLTFYPFAESAKPTIIASFGCHPESASYDWLKTDGGIEMDTKLSADFIYYMDKLINKAGYNFIYIQGDVGTNTSARGRSNDGLSVTANESARRYGYEMAYITLATGQGLDENGCKALDDRLGKVLYTDGESYTPWYKGLKPTLNVEVEPMLNIKLKQMTIEVENNVAKILTKAGIANNKLIYDSASGKYYSVTEIGYMELGSALKVFLCPGETFTELLLGGDCLDGFKYPALREVCGDNLIIFDLCNDAAGYFEPDNYYTIAGYQYDPEKDSLESDTWCLLISFGKNAASTIVGEFIELTKSVR